MTTPNLQLAELSAGLAQPHLTLNETLRDIDSILDGVVDSIQAFSEPNFDIEVYGTRHIITGNPSGAWTGRPMWIANYRDGAWHYTRPRSGMLVWYPGDGTLNVYRDDVNGWWGIATITSP